MKLLKEITTTEAREAIDRIESGEYTQDDINCLRAFCDRMDGLLYAIGYWRGLCVRLQTEADAYLTAEYGLYNSPVKRLTSEG